MAFTFALPPLRYALRFMMRIADAATAHSGEKLHPGMRIFALPPPEIGDVLSASSNLASNEEPVTPLKRLTRAALLTCLSGWVALLVLLIPAAIFVWILEHGFGVGQELAQLLAKVLVFAGSAVVAAVTAPIAWQVNGPFPRCTYVGREGLARFSWGERLPNAVLRFAEAKTLRRRVRTLRQKRSFSLDWYGGRGIVRLFSIAGSVAPKEDDLSFAIAAERAWNAFLLERAREEILVRGFFELVRDVKDSSKRARIGPSFVDLIDGDRIERWTPLDVDVVEVDRGSVIARRHDPLRGRSSIEKRYPGGEMDNESFFPFVLREIARLPVEDVAPRLAPVDS